ncbi:DNA helicase [Alteromonas gilva]|uniref:DNA helicase n=1 Tax=Alteromonas gilva TaxID=2987522 RepID=A0ABT5L491_9ALTE|nr:DNA helicase [Alteromonas gilva]MDC8831854.1 DNA helicase [Alteromonas gilva]
MAEDNHDLFFDKFDCETDLKRAFRDSLKEFSAESKVQIYLLQNPLTDNKYTYNYRDAAIVLAPKHKIMIVNLGNDDEQFEDFCDDFIDDLSSISDKYDYKKIIGRVRKWRDELVAEIQWNDDTDVGTLFDEASIADPKTQRNSELLISLVTGSINDVSRIKDETPENILDKIKQKIQLFDGDQTRFIYSFEERPEIRIQGLSGTGKTELLLHKLRDIYVNRKSSRVMLTCHNKILSYSLAKRIPEFFNFMKVEEQIEWNKRLWCVNAWGSTYDANSGAYRYICGKYGIPFQTYGPSFSSVCSAAVAKLKNEDMDKLGYAFDYMLIDESQDLPDEFIELAKIVTKNTVYIAGDIFQSIFDENILDKVTPDYLLSKCYRTDPRTLMFAHAIGMGLFEDTKLRWLKDDEWAACGYHIEKNGNEYKLTREPLRRFEDLDSEDLTSIELVTRKDAPDTNLVQKSFTCIESILGSHPTASVDDFGIVYLGTKAAAKRFASLLEFKVKEKYGWDINLAFETRQNIEGQLFVSNKFNVKGLEFPFMLCIASDIPNQLHERNALYMLLTRSFLKSFLILGDHVDGKLISKLEAGINHINEYGCIVTEAPVGEELDKIKTTIEHSGRNQSLNDIIVAVFEELNILPIVRPHIKEMVMTRQKMIGKRMTEAEVREFITIQNNLLHEG